MKILIFLLFANIFIFGQTNKDSNVEKKPIENVKASPSDTINEKNVYKLLYEETKQTNDRLVSTVHWALGGVVALALFLMGYNAFYNFKINKDQIKNVNKEFENKIEKVRNEDATNLNAKLEENKKEYEDKLTQNYEYINSELDSKIISLTETYEKQTNAYRESNELQVKTLEKSIDERVKNVNESIQISKNDSNEKFVKLNNDIEKLDKKFTADLKLELNLLKYEFYYAEARLWDIKKVPGNVLTSYVSALKVVIDSGFKTEYTLNKILETLDKMDDIWKSDKELLEELLKKIDVDSLLKGKIMTKLSKIKIDENY